ncbi:MAG: cation:proton antiporter [Rhodobacteraceae bacterium]|nr:cation:proton antiporter [Paracoccaceae bacterium]
MEGFFYQATIFLAAAVIAVPIAARLGLGSVLGYLSAGILIGPVFGLVSDNVSDLQHFAEFGVVMMLFLIGLELEPRALWDMRHRLIGLGGLQILLTMAAVTAWAVGVGQPFKTGLAIGMIFALSSTAIVLQTLSEKGLMQTQGGRSTFSVLLTQDIAVIPMLILLPLLAVPMEPTFGPDGSVVRPGADAADKSHEALSLVEGLPGWGVTLVTLGAIAAIILAGIYLTRPVFRFIHIARLREMYTALALLMVISIAFVMSLVGLSPALGTFLAGVVLANTEFRHELEADIEPFKGLLLGLFFITVGAGLNFAVFLRDPVTIVTLTLSVMVLKGLILFGLGHLFRLKGRNQWLFTLGLAQAGEFGFVLISFSVQQHVLPVPLAETLLLSVGLTMLLTPLFFILYEWLSKRLGEGGEEMPADVIDEQGPIIIAGIGRFGQVVNRMVQTAGLKTTVLDHDLKTIELMRSFGFKSFFGDPTRPELLHAAGLKKASVLVVALDDPDKATRLVRFARQERPDLHIVARARDRIHVFQLFKAGADDIVREMFDSSLRAGRYVLENMGLTDFEAAEMTAAFSQLDRESLKELAELWRPGVPIEKNEAYVARARQLNKDLETALLEKFEQGRETRKTGT